jgi:hypothetical protein
MRRKLVAGNWKMHGNFQKNAALLNRLVLGVNSLDCEVVVCVPFPYLGQVQSLVGGSSVLLGAQNLSEHISGAYTGEVSAPMLLEFGCRYVLVGHSERRAIYGESDVVVAAKFAVAQANGLIPVLCLGETLLERQSGVTVEVVSRQLEAVLNLLGVETLCLRTLFLLMSRCGLLARVLLHPLLRPRRFMRKFGRRWRCEMAGWQVGYVFCTVVVSSRRMRRNCLRRLISMVGWSVVLRWLLTTFWLFARRRVNRR